MRGKPKDSSHGHCTEEFGDDSVVSASRRHLAIDKRYSLSGKSGVVSLEVSEVSLVYKLQKMGLEA